MSAAVKVVSFTIAIADESEFAEGDGLGSAAAVSFAFDGAVWADGRAAVALRGAGFGLAFCATTAAANTSANNKTKGDVRFIKGIFLTVAQVVNWRYLRVSSP
jgi:hypothetical protein